MKLTFLGADHEVTGSCTYIEAAGKRLLVDYGMEQGQDCYDNAPIPVLPKEIDYVLLTHAHIDHSGLLPLLYRNGFKGEIHATVPTAHLCDIMLRDSAHIQESEADWKNRKGARRGDKPVEPLYDSKDAEGALKLFHGHPYDERFSLCPGVDVRFTDAGHLLGSSSVEIWITENGKTEKIVFSGDIGNIKQPLIRDPQFVDEADYVVLESTYGDREHTPPPDYATALAEILQETFDRGGNVVIPSFAVGRTQELLYFIRHIKEQGLVHGHDRFPVYVDSPLAIAATKIFVDNADFCYDEEAASLLRKGINPIAFEGLTTAVSSDESIAINTTMGSKVIISASGMCEAGRIRHHLKHNLWRPESTILFVGYQSVGTLGRILCEGAKTVKIFGEDIAVNAQVRTLAGISGHGDCNELIRWVTHISPKPKRVFVNHGEDAVCELFAARLRDEFGLDAVAPYTGAEFDLAANAFVLETHPEPIKETKRAAAPVSGQAPQLQPKKKPAPARETAYGKLVIAVQRLVGLLGDAQYRAGAELDKLARRINDLCNDWEQK